MDLLTHVFLESPFWLGGFCFGLFAFVLLARPRWGRRGAAYALPLTLLVIALLFIVQRLVVTQREHIRQRLDVFINAIERQDSSTIRHIISDAYQSEGMNRDVVHSYIDGRLQHLRVYDTRVPGPDVEIDGDNAEMELVASATVSVEGGVGDRHLGRWRIQWTRDGDDWKITSIQPRMIDMVRIESLRELQGYAP
jgi:hypothetical protein